MFTTIDRQQRADRLPCSRPAARQRVVHHTFQSVLVGDLFAHKMAGFADHFDAKIRKVSDGFVRMQIGTRGFLAWSDRAANFPVDVRVQLELVAGTTDVYQVNVELRPVAMGVPKRHCQKRYEAILRELHAFLIPQLSSVPEFHVAAELPTQDVTCERP